MLQKLLRAIRPSKGRRLARALSLLGWAGFWIQVVFGTLPILLMVYYMAFSRSGTVSRSGLPVIGYLTVANLLILLFTTWWSYRYTRLARRFTDPERRPTEPYVIGFVWTGVVAGATGMLFSMIVLLIETANLSFYLLRAPQGGIPVIQTSGVEPVHWVSPVDLVSLMVLTLNLLAELVVLLFSLWLLFQATLGSPEFPETTPTGDKN
jgi:hypothetical protein